MGRAEDGRRAVALGLLFVVAGCADDRPAPEAWAGTIDTTSSGTVVVTNPEAPLDGGERAWRLIEELRIGSMMEDGPAAFGRIGDLLVDPEGTIYVLEAQAQEIRVFGPDGEFLRRIGGEGQGPGEFSQVMAMGWGLEGQLRVADVGNSRLSVFDRSGSLLVEHQLPSGVMAFPWLGGFVNDGGVIAPIPGRDRREFRPALVRYDASFEPVDTLSIPRFSGNYGDDNVFELTSESGKMTVTVPYSPDIVWTIDPAGYFWIAPNTSDYRIHRVSFAGDTVLTIARQHQPIRVTPTEIDSAVAGLAWFTNQGGRIDRSKFPDQKPALTSLLVTPNGDLIVVPVTDDFGSGWRAAARVIDVFDPSGRYRARLALPEGMQAVQPAPFVSGDAVYAVVKDELDVSYVVRYRLDRGSRSGTSSEE